MTNSFLISRCYYNVSLMAPIIVCKSLNCKSAPTSKHLSKLSRYLNQFLIYSLLFSTNQWLEEWKPKFKIWF